MDTREEISVVVFANRKDFALTKICVASIRYFYPDVEIFLVKDKLNGNFYTKRLCNTFNVNLMDLGRKYFGWGAAKIHFILNKNLPKKRYLCVDSDIIFIGRVLDKLQEVQGKFIVNPDWQTDPFNKEVISLYLDIKKVKKHYPDYKYPGYFFNSGQFVATPGLLTEALIAPAFNAKRYPYYKDSDAFALVDQGVFNAVLPVFEQRTGTMIKQTDFMKWSVSFFKNENNNHFENFEDGETKYLIHYAGDVRTYNLNKMKGTELLIRFHQYYHERLSKFERRADQRQDWVYAKKGLGNILYKKNRLLIELSSKMK